MKPANPEKESISFRISTELKSTMIERATARNMSLSNYIRSLVYLDIERAKLKNTQFFYLLKNERNELKFGISPDLDRVREENENATLIGVSPVITATPTLDVSSEWMKPKNCDPSIFSKFGILVMGER